MKADNELILDIIYKREKEIQLYIREFETSIDAGELENIIYYNCDIAERKDEMAFLQEIEGYIEKDFEGLTYLKGLLNSYKEASITNKYMDISKYAIIKRLLKEYKIIYKKNYWNNKRLGLQGIFNNELFCGLVKNKIDKYTNCNKVTKNKYRHLVAFLNELLVELENSIDPLKTLSDKIKIYEKHRKSEVVKIKLKEIDKVTIIREILEEYKENKNKIVKC